MPHQIPGIARDERGMVLPLALMTLVVVGSLTVALLGIGSSEVQVASNHAESAQAHFLADAGLEDAYGYFRANPGQVPVAPAAFTAVPGLQGPGPALSAHGAYTVQYRSGGANTVLILATGTTTGGSTEVLRATMTTAFKAQHAILAKRTLTISGNPTVGGSCGRAHTNENMVISGNPTVTGAATASGSYSVSGNPQTGSGSGGNKPPVAIPEVNPAKFFDVAKAQVSAGTMAANQVFHLKSNGQVFDGAGTLVTSLTPGQSFNGWKRETGLWSMSGNTGYTGTYYLEGDAKISGNPGSITTPWNTTVLATGDIEVSGNPEIKTHLTDTLFVAGQDVKMSGNPGLGFTGLIAAHEQVAISGNPDIKGYVIAENAASTSETVVQDSLNGNPSLTFNCDLNAPLTGAIRILAWGP